MAQQQRNPLQSIGNTLRSRKNLDHQPEQGRKRTNQNSNLNEQENKPDCLDPPFQKKAKSDNNYQPTNQYNTRSVTEQKESKNGKLSQCETSSLPAKSKRKKNAILKEVSIVLGCSDELEEGCSEQESEETTLQEQIEKWLREREKEYAANPDYLKWQPNITAKMRAILLEWMMEVAEEYELHRETMGMAINYVDRFLSIHPKISKESFQLVGIGALFIAAKLEEYDILQPGVLVSVTDNAYPAESLLQMERLMANSFQWNLLPPTPYLWLKLFMQRVSRIKKTEFPKADFSRGMQFLDICSLDVKYIKFLPSALAASVFYKFFLPPKGILFSEITGFEIEELSECLEWTNTFGTLPRNPDPRLTKMDSFEFQFKTTGFDSVVQKFRQQDPNAMSD